ncbi:MAG TPA: glycosyltransferase family 39 protein [Gaiellaceae bacterium]|nr:glycosyltransferase family 39 protein [Gaiellaceae bacterium]
MTRALQGVLSFVPTRRAAIALFVLAFVVFWIESLGWPMAKGRDTWDYLVYYLQLLDADPPISELQVFRTPLTPIVVGLPLDLGGTWLLEGAFALLYAGSILGWSATALTFGRIPALFTALLLLVYPAYATLFHQASSDAVFATGLALWAWLLARAMQTPTGWRFAAVGAGIGALVLIRPASQVLLPLAFAPLIAYLGWRRRLVLTCACLVAAVVPLAGWALHNGVRYDESSVARGGRAWVPFLQVFTANKTISPENGAASARLAELIEREVLSRDPHARFDVSLDAYLRNGSNYEVVRLIALSDTVLGRDDDYDVLFDSALEAIRESPGTYFRGVAETFWDFLVQKPLRENVAPRAQTAPDEPSPTFESGGETLPNPQVTVLLLGVPYGFVWCASDYIDSCTAEDPSQVWSDPDTQERYREIVARVRGWDAELPSREGVSFVPEVLNRITPRFPTPPLWLAVGVVGLVVRRPRDWRTILLLWAAAFLVLLIHAASQGVAPEFALPVYPIFIVAALGALAGERGPRTQLASTA